MCVAARISATRAREAILQLADGEVDAHLEAGLAREELLPALQLTAGLLDDPEADRNEGAALLGEVDEVGGHEEAARRMVPAQERLEAHDLARLDGELGLVEEAQLVLGDGLAQVGLEVELLHGRRSRFEVEDLEASPAFSLGAVEGDVGAAEEISRAVDAGLTEGDADADGEEELVSFDQDGPVHGPDQALGDVRRFGDVFQVIHEYDELVAAEAREGVGGTNALA